MSTLKPIILAAAVASSFFNLPVHAAGADKHPMADFNTCAKPHYPAASLAAKHEGKVDMAFLVDTSGAVREAKVVKSSGHEALDVSARDAIKLCKFVPAQKDGKAVEEWAKVQYVWKLK